MAPGGSTNRVEDGLVEFFQEHLKSLANETACWQEALDAMQQAAQQFDNRVLKALVMSTHAK
eukprot:3605737-Amphidinium_carterae.1